MTWNVCIRYSNGKEKVLRSYRNREKALRCVDAIYNTWGYPLHLAYIVRAGDAQQMFQTA
ncbi:family 2 glycosyl transferase [Floridanema aerugineum]|jgi:hypothetical protein|uniref:Family 2 glycosyl transferase n=1 Tax=Floridaenema aerugineum BLCC-F46 TaxID=3153654 RepID=A0ABV4XH76_9CYAN